MTTDQTSPIPAEVAAVRAGEAGALIDAALKADVHPSASNVTSINYAGAVKALLTATVANGQALLAIHADLARIANALEKPSGTTDAIDRTAAALAYIRDVADAMRPDDNPLAKLAAVADGGLDGVSAELSALSAAVDDLAARPHWWQWRLRRTQRHAPSTPSAADAAGI